jgi:hypothetical protein
MQRTATLWRGWSSRTWCSTAADAQVRRKKGKKSHGETYPNCKEYGVLATRKTGIGYFLAN